MRTRTHTHTRGLTPRPALLRGFAAPRLPSATSFSTLVPSCGRAGSAPGWRLTAQLPKVIQKCKKVAKSLEVKKSFLIFAANLKIMLMTVQEFFEKYEVDDDTDRPFSSCELCALKTKCGEYFLGCPLPAMTFFKLKQK